MRAICRRKIEPHERKFPPNLELLACMKCRGNNTEATDADPNNWNAADTHLGVQIR